MCILEFVEVAPVILKIRAHEPLKTPTHPLHCYGQLYVIKPHPLLGIYWDNGKENGNHHILGVLLGILG